MYIRFSFILCYSFTQANNMTTAINSLFVALPPGTVGNYTLCGSNTIKQTDVIQEVVFYPGQSHSEVTTLQVLCASSSILL